MSAYIVVGFTPKDTEKLQQYGASVPATLAAYEGELLAKGPVDQLHGENPFSAQVIIAFPSKEKASGWYQSAEYQALIPLRNQGMNAQFQLIG